MMIWGPHTWTETRWPVDLVGNRGSNSTVWVLGDELEEFGFILVPSLSEGSSKVATVRSPFYNHKSGCDVGMNCEVVNMEDRVQARSYIYPWLWQGIEIAWIVMVKWRLRKET